MNKLPHAVSHTVADAHGRHVDLTLTGPPLRHHCSCTSPTAGPRPRGRPGVVAIRVAAVLTVGLVISVLLVVIRDIVTTVASTSATGLIVKPLLLPSGRRER